MKKETEKKIEELCNLIECDINLTDGDKQAMLDKIKEVLACEANDVKLGKMDLYSFVDTSKYSEKKWLSGVFYSGGNMYASDARIMLKLKGTYKEDFEGKVVFKDGGILNETETETVGRKYNMVMDKYLAGYAAMADYELDFNQLKEVLALAKAHQKMYKKRAVSQIKLGDVHVDTPRFEKFCNVLNHFGVNTFKIGAADKPIIAHTDEFTLLLMPMLEQENGESIQVLDMSPWWY